MAEAFRRAIDRHRMISPGASVLAAVSGGGDSVLMLRLLVQHRAACPFELRVAHLNHALRGAESDADEAFVRDLAARHGLAFTSARADLTRAPGRRGLAGMSPATADGFIRPLIGVRRAAVRAYLSACGEAYRDDATNEDVTRTRNRIRLRLAPILEAEFEGAIERLAAEAELLAPEEAFLDEAAATLLAGAASTIPPRVGEAPIALARRAVRLAAEASGNASRRLERDHVDAILDLLRRAAAGQGIDLPGGARAEKGPAGVVIREPGERSG
ncbi:MAG: tRNA lysidine(34) synthetase TilS [Acidobacteria bacterium]|nr:tRNA lysidine(34) synthetase TilS [Acidobacteriota bacterium]